MRREQCLKAGTYAKKVSEVSFDFFEARNRIVLAVKQHRIL